MTLDCRQDSQHLWQRSGIMYDRYFPTITFLQDFRHDLRGQVRIESHRARLMTIQRVYDLPPVNPQLNACSELIQLSTHIASGYALDYIHVRHTDN